MGNIKVKHNDAWKVVSSNTANGISANSPLIQKDENTSVEDVLVDHEGRVDKLEKNVAWLAKYGIGKGGSGGGGSSEDYEATCTITVNDKDQASSSNGIGFDASGITIRLENISKNSYSGSWTVNVEVGNKLIRSASVSYSRPSLSIPYSTLLSNLSNHSLTLNITASYYNSQKGIEGLSTWKGVLYESVVELSVADVSTDSEDITADPDIQCSFSVGKPGNYTLNISASREGVSCGTTALALSIPDSELHIEHVSFLSVLDGSIQPGVYDLITTLTSNEDSSLTASSRSVVNCIGSSIIISSSTLSSDQNNPVIVSTSGMFNLEWTAYVNNSPIFNYYYTLSDGTESEEIGPKNGTFNRIVKDAVSAYGKDWLTVDGTAVSLTIRVVSSIGSEATKTYYFLMEKSSKSFVPMRDKVLTSQLCDFGARNYNLNDRDFTIIKQGYKPGTAIQTYTLTSHLDIKNDSNLCGIKGSSSGVPYLRISNGAYGELSMASSSPALNNLNFKNLVQDGTFTLSICFKADYHPDDTRTILSWGRSDTVSGIPQSGIEIGVHHVYVDNASVKELVDNTVNMVDIVCEKHEEEFIDSDGERRSGIHSIIKVYVNGVPSGAVNVAGSFASNLSDVLYLGGKVYGGSLHEEWCCDCNIYNFQIYNKALSDFDIAINTINNQVSTTAVFINGHYEFDYDLIDELLVRNMCYRDSETGTIKSIIYDVDSDQFMTPSNIINKDGKLDVSSIGEDVYNVFGIPVMFIDVSTNDNWNFNEFVTRQSENAETTELGPTTGKVSYWDPTGNDVNVKSFENVTVSLQGTSTLADAVKNINITLPAGTVFIPKTTWLPEQTYTLKADVVDSSHSCNAAIGKFVNEVLGRSENPFMPLPENVVNAFNNSDYKRNIHKSATLKRTVEGFPVFLIMRFAVTNSSIISTTPLGIYSFNLGRNAYRNLGFKIITRIDNLINAENGITQFPYVATDCVIQEEDLTARWVEINDTTPVQGIQSLIKNNDPSFDSASGAFWQDDPSIAALRYSVRYPEGGQLLNNDSFLRLIRQVMLLPIESGYETFNSLGEINKDDKFIHFNTYLYDGGSYQEKSSIDSISNTNDYEGLHLNLESAYAYFSVCCAFGLVDNLSKNSTYRLWGSPDENDYYLGLYDLDCAFGGSNQGNLDVSPTLWIKYFNNSSVGEVDGTSYGYAYETYDEGDHLGHQTLFSGSTSKLWLSIDTHFLRRYSNDQDLKSRYSQYWANLRTYLQGAASQAGYSDVIDYFMEEYFLAQTRSCGPLLFSLDYRLKYFFQFDFTSTAYPNIKFLSKLHGRREAETRDWLKRRFLFLDSLFAWRDSSITYQFDNDYNTKLNGHTVGTPIALPVKYNTSLIFNHSVGSGAKSYYYAPANTEVFVETSGISGGGDLTWSCTNTPQLMQLGNSSIPLSMMHVRDIGHTPGNAWSKVGLPAMTSLMLHGNTSFSGNNNDLLTSFVASDSNSVSELREIDLSNTSTLNNVGSVTLNLVSVVEEGGNISYVTKFTKLRSLDISNSSAITNIIIPPIPLRYLNISYSSITSFNLQNQKFLENVDLSGCSYLTTVNIESCDAYEELSLNSLSNLTDVTVTRNESLSSIHISNCPHLRNVRIAGNNSLSEISVTGCSALDNVSISNCGALQSLNFSDNDSLDHLSISNISWDTINTLNLSESPITHIVGNDTDEEEDENVPLLDLYLLTGLTSFNINRNTAVRRIQFANNKGNAISVPGFNGCTSLERVYGHISLTNRGSNQANSPFYSCKLFTLHGNLNSGLGPNLFKGKSVYSNTDHRVKTIWELFDADTSDDKWNDVFQEGKKKTNFEFATGGSGTNSFGYTFYGTSLTQFDVYYACYAIARAMKNKNFSLSYTFYNLERISGQRQLFEFNRSGNYLNHPPRSLFTGWNTCKSISYGFGSTNNSSNSETYILSPEVNLEGEVTSDNGVFSPLTSLTTFHRVFYPTSISFSKNVFKRSSGNYVITSIQTQPMKNLYPNDAWLDSNTTVPITALGNFDGFFDNLTSLNFIDRTLNFQYIDFSTIHLPNSSKTILNAFKASTGGTGSVSFSSIFRNGGNDVVNLAGSFTSTILESYGTQATFVLSNDTFVSIPNLKVFGYKPSSYGSSSENYDTSITNYTCRGVKKEIEGAFPASILYSVPSIEVITNLFEDCNAISITTDFPGNMFVNTPNVQYIDAFFKNSNIHLNLTSGGFANCPSLKSVSQLFCEESPKNRQCLENQSIPYKFLYHGENTYTLTYKGSNTDPELSEDVVPETKSITVNIPLSTISDVSGMFKGCYLLQPYKISNSNDIIEDNPDYRDFGWLYDDVTSTWKVNTEIQEHQAYWGFDGDFNSLVYNQSFFTDNKLIEQVHSDFSVDLIYSQNKSDTSVNYICPPDLLRYCTPTCNVEGLFELCGVDYIGTTGVFNGHDKYNDGIKGRICPYMLKPVSGVTSIARMFKYCRMLSGYEDASNIYLIPPSFFDYTPKLSNLTEAFEGIIYPEGVTLSVFTKLTSSLIIDKIFAFSHYSGTTALSGIFNNRNISSLTATFSYNDISLNPLTPNQYRTISIPNNITASNNFSGANISQKSGNRQYVYYGWGAKASDAAIPNSENNY